MSMTVKAYLELPDGKAEIRRFPVDQGVSSSFTYLSNKIPQVFPSLAGKQFDLFWKDDPDKNDLKPLKCSKKRKRKVDNCFEDQGINNKIIKTENLNENTEDGDNDNIAFSSDDELTEALGYVNDGLFKVYIKQSDRGPTTSNCGTGAVHPGVVCDGCESDIRGSRFKCCACPDYDLCSECEGKGLHPEHPMIRIRSSENWMPGQGFNMPPPFHGPPPPFHGHPPPPHHGHPPPPFGGGQFGGPPPFGGPFGGGPFGGGPGHCKPWRKMMKRCWRKWWKNMYEQQGEQDGVESDSDKEMKEPKEPRKEKESMQNDAKKGEDGDSPTEEYLKDVGESVAAMLDPLGIDVDVDVECHGKRKKCHGGRGRGWGWRGRGRGFGPWMFGPSGFMGRCGFPGGMGRGMSPDGAEASASAASQQGEKTDVPMHESNQATNEPRTGETASFDVQMGSPLQNSEQGDGDWMLLGQEKESSNCMGNPQREPQPSSPPLHPIPKMAEALEQLQAMGFTDEGGWLTQLIEAKNGDLNKVLDALKPYKPQPN